MTIFSSSSPPLPVAPPRAGWTAARQISFIERLAQIGVVPEAARSVGMSASSAHHLRAIDLHPKTPSR